MTVSPELAALSPEEITRKSKSSFALSFAFLSKPRRRGISAVYAYCRAVDDAVDEAETRAAGVARLAAWRSELERAVVAAHDPSAVKASPETGPQVGAQTGPQTGPQTATGVALAETIAAFDIPPRHLRAVADGCAMDLDAPEFADLPALEHYCSLVASAVGLCCLPVFGVSEDVAGEYADRLGKALQITNILRDLRTDAEIGRCYVPADFLAAAGVERAWLSGAGPAAAYVDGGPVHRLVDALAAVARERFAEARAALPANVDDQRRLLPAEIMRAVYERLLEAAIARRGRIDKPERLRLTKWQKLRIAGATWWRERRRRRSARRS